MESMPSNDQTRTINRSDEEAMAGLSEGMRAFLDRLHEAQDIFRQIQANVFGPQQQELEQLLNRGVGIVNEEFQNVKSEAKSGVNFLLETFRNNPSVALFAAMRMGLALRQALKSREDLSPLREEVRNETADDLRDRSMNQSLH